MKKILLIIFLNFLLSVSVMAQEEFVPALCLADKPLMGDDGVCYACDTLKKFEVRDIVACSEACQTAEGQYIRKSVSNDCELITCPTGYEKDVHGNCIKKPHCPDDAPLLDERGVCHSCKTLERIKLMNETDCDLCQGLRETTFWGCVLKECPEGTQEGSFDDCIEEVKAECPPDKPLREHDKCYGCDYPLALGMSDNEIGKCTTLCVDEKGYPMRKSYHIHGGTVCGLLRCPPEKPLFSNGNCYACDTLEAIESKNCFVCDVERREVKQGRKTFCTLKKCPTSHSLPDMNGNCRSCDEYDDIYVSIGMCQKVCPNRYAKKVGKNDLTSEFDLIDANKYEKCEPAEEPSLFSLIKIGKKELKYKDCPVDKPVMDYQGGCYSCDNPSEIWSISGCEKCPNRKKSGGWGNSFGKGATCVLLSDTLDK